MLDARSGEARKVGALDAASGRLLAEPVVTGDTLLAASGDELHAVHLPDVDELWKFEGGLSLRPPVVAGRRVLWPSTSGNALDALDLDTGEVLWKAPLPGAGGVVVGGDVAYANPASAFDLNTGKPLWRAETGGNSASGRPALGASGSVLFAGMGGGETGSVAAFDARSGEEKWRSGLGDDVVKPSDRLWVSGDAVVAPLQSGDVVAFDAHSGEEIWRYEPQAPRLGNITVEGGSVWFALQNGEVLALDAESGETVARSNDYSLNLYGTSLDQRPAFVGGTMVLGVGTYVLGFAPPEGVDGS
jgi:outer membrane protein assembly factor BamB